MINIPGYNILNQICESVNSRVYRGRRIQDDLPVILKILKADYSNTPSPIGYKKEYEIVRSLNNIAGVIKAYSLEKYRSILAIVFEDFGGESLKKIMETKKFTISEFLTIAIQITETLSQIHAANIIHKDINPFNIVLNPETDEVKLIDFGISKVLTREKNPLKKTNSLEGTLAYMSPEQTGRMNRSVDYRTDFYSLGVTFYEMLAGSLPFAATDTMELIHCHIAMQPVPPHQLDPKIPKAVSDIVMKLLAKTAEERYQSAWGIHADLVICQMQLEANDEIEDLIPGENDIFENFQIPQKLYGRKREVEALLAAFERVSNGAIEMTLISGYSGIGKSALMQKIYQSLSNQKGYFISGKFDQFQQNIPYSGLIQAFQELIEQLLTESEDRLNQWRDKLLTALGEQGKVIIDAIPSVELIVGKQPDAIAMPPIEAQNRFNLVFQNFIRVFSQQHHPFVIFLDNLQWADSATLKLIELIMTDTDTHSLFLIGAYRDNEVEEQNFASVHPLILKIDEIKKAGAVVNHISLSPLNLSKVTQLISDTLQCTQLRARPLAELVLVKTQGNPFFINEFLKSLYAEGLFYFDLKTLSWQWVIDKIKEREITDNVVELMTGKIQKLNESAQQVLKLAACIGNQFDLDTLAVVCKKSPREAAADLWKAVTEGLVLPLDDAYKMFGNGGLGYANETPALRDWANFPKPSSAIAYKFAHDRIQQAAYSLISSEQKQAIHRQVGQLLLQNTPPNEREEKIFEIVNHLNSSIELINGDRECYQLAELNLMAGQRAKAAAAYQSAFSYLTIGVGLLQKDSWETQYDLTLALYVEAAEAVYFSGDFERMERLADVVLQRAKTLLDKVKIYEVKIQAFIAQNKLIEAVKTALQILKLLGVKLPENPKKLDIWLGFAKTKLVLLGKRVEDLIDLPPMTDPNKKAAMRILASAFTAAFIGVPKLLPLIAFKQVNLSVQYGNTSESACAYANYGLILCGLLGDIQSGYKFGLLALKLVERFNAKPLKARIVLWVNGCIRHWKEHAKETLKSFLEAYSCGLETGNLEDAALAGFAHSVISYFIGKELAGLEREIANYSEALFQMGQKTTLNYQKISHQAVLSLLGQTENPCRLIGELYDEEKMLPLHREANDGNAIFYLHLHKLILCYLFQEFDRAVENAAIAQTYLDSLTGAIVIPIFYFYDSLARLALCASASKSEQKRLLHKVRANQKKMQKWAACAPMNHLHKFYLVKAELSRVLGRDRLAMDYYDKAIALAKEYEYLNEEALASELAAKFYWLKNKVTIASAYLQEARYCYFKWGATAKVRDLEARYPQLLQRKCDENAFELHSINLSTLSTTLGNKGSKALDLTTVMKASQAIASEIVLDKLLANLMKSLIENAGAQKGFLILIIDGKLLISAEASVDRDAIAVLQSTPVEASSDLPLTLIKYVERTCLDVVLSDAIREGQFSNDPYIAKRQLKSLLCSPIVNQGKLIGILYLENNLTAGAFTSDRLEVLRLLSSQAAISLDNAMLYTNLAAAKEQLESYSRTLEVRVEERTQELKAKEARLAEAQKLARLGSWEWNLISQEVKWSDELFSIYGIDSSQPIPTRSEHTKILHPDDLEYVCQIIDRALQFGENYEIDYRILHPNGSVKYVFSKAQTIKDSKGKVIKLFGTVQDITDRKLAEEALRQSETREREKSQQLELTVQELKRTQAQLIQSEKMSSLGQMVAGVAHEINNPISFIYGNLSFASQYIQQMFALIETYQQEYPKPTPKIVAISEDIDLAFMAKDLQRLLISMKGGAERIRDIVLSLRNFSRLDESSMKPVNIHQGIDSTLMLLQPRLRGETGRVGIEVIKEYGQLPAVTCYASGMNQVFMNILSNAIDALEEGKMGAGEQGSRGAREQGSKGAREQGSKGAREQGSKGAREPGSKGEGKIQLPNPQSPIPNPQFPIPNPPSPIPTIRIRTEVTNSDTIVIRISDNGPGMSSQVQKKIFDPFFTTKPVGSGTGLGLSVSYQIVVDRHGGQLNCVSQLGQGTEFAIAIPIAPKK